MLLEYKEMNSCRWGGDGSYQSVSVSIRNALFSEPACQLFLVFHMKLGPIKAQKWLGPIFEILANFGKKIPKLEFWEFWRKSSPLICTFCCEKWKFLWSSIILRKPQFREKSDSREKSGGNRIQNECFIIYIWFYHQILIKLSLWSVGSNVSGHVVSSRVLSCRVKPNGLKVYAIFLGWGLRLGLRSGFTVRGLGLGLGVRS